MTKLYKNIFILLLTLSVSTVAIADESLWDKTKNWAGGLWGSTKEGASDATDWSKKKLKKGTSATEDGVKDGVEWSEDKVEKGANKVEKGADWGVDKAKKGWSATKKGSKSFWKELTSDDESSPENSQKK